MCASALALATQRGTIVLRRLPESGPWFAPRGPTPDNAVFSRDSFAACDRRDVELSFVPPTPCTSRLREPNRSLRVLTLSVARWCAPGPSAPRCARPCAPKERRTECHRARAFRSHDRFRVTGLPAQSAFSWLDLALRPGEPRSPYRSEERFAPRTPLSLPLGDPPCHGDGSPPTAISSPPPALPPPRRGKPPRKWCTRKRCLSPTSAADFCCHEYPLGSQLPSPRLASPGPPHPARSLCRRLSANSRTEPSSAMPNSRCRRLRPWVVT
jgi:hypothetical protein